MVISYLMYDILPDLERWFENSNAIALATVISTWGSAPRGVGAKMAISPDGKISGSVSGGCVEGAVYEAGMRVLKTGEAELLRFGVADEQAFEVGLACGGTIEVFVQKLELPLFEALREDLVNRQPAAAVSVIRGPQDQIGSTILVSQKGVQYTTLTPELTLQAAELARQSLMEGSCSQSELPVAHGEQVTFFAEAILPHPVLVIVGGVHIAITLAALAKPLGYQVIVVDPRKTFGSAERFPHVDRLIQAWPDEAFEEIPLTPNTCVAMLTHDPKIDDPAMKIVLNSPVFYIGALGSRKTQEKRRERLLGEGLTREQLDRIHGPIGLDLGGRTPEETAVAVMAEIVAVRRGRNLLKAT